MNNFKHCTEDVVDGSVQSKMMIPVADQDNDENRGDSAETIIPEDNLIEITATQAGREEERPKQDEKRDDEEQAGPSQVETAEEGIKLLHPEERSKVEEFVFYAGEFVFDNAVFAQSVDVAKFDNVVESRIKKAKRNFEPNLERCREHNHDNKEDKQPKQEKEQKDDVGTRMNQETATEADTSENLAKLLGRSLNVDSHENEFSIPLGEVFRELAETAEKNLMAMESHQTNPFAKVKDGSKIEESKRYLEELNRQGEESKEHYESSNKMLPDKDKNEEVEVEENKSNWTRRNSKEEKKDHQPLGNQDENQLSNNQESGKDESDERDEHLTRLQHQEIEKFQISNAKK